jgi:hypothetical protein
MPILYLPWFEHTFAAEVSLKGSVLDVVAVRPLPVPILSTASHPTMLRQTGKASGPHRALPDLE